MSKEGQFFDVANTSSVISPERLPVLRQRVAFLTNAATVARETDPITSFIAADRADNPSDHIFTFDIDGQSRTGFPPQQLTSWSEEGHPWDLENSRLLLSRINSNERLSIAFEFLTQGNDSNDVVTFSLRGIFNDAEGDEIMRVLYPVGSAGLIRSSAPSNLALLRQEIALVKPVGDIYRDGFVNFEFIELGGLPNANVRYLPATLTLLGEYYYDS